MPTHVVSTICDDRGEEPTYAGVTMTSLMTGDFCVGDVISLLWFKRQLPQYATRFIEMCVMLCADHGPCVSGLPTPSFAASCSTQKMTCSALGCMMSQGEGCSIAAHISDGPVYCCPFFSNHA